MDDPENKPLAAQQKAVLKAFSCLYLLVETLFL